MPASASASASHSASAPGAARAARSGVPRALPAGASLPGVRWLRSSHSTGMNNCVETACPGSGPCVGLVAVRDSKRVPGPAVLFAPGAWRDFLDSLG
ncbi:MULTISPECIES: DUF397 domain-containing protein [Streptomyces]|jgi:hypothetical protein|uniref:DUF397 domain-containing protein n=1 Tax=Streptomyces griseoaurantiacus M045 TaxID=996637 RepID=F3NTN1_9ACTN|nr:hypothetical protein SGM_6331 [Streptomyces griseoaurantiacus M045]MCF0085251.1 hypothetical protein [Streptomyces sp. MH192]MCF0097818.1 hypothetical protein [Streptomyces sp. MH191]NJP74311.1 DUF397 domain-containing protein [Streptomyces sp. C1-2]